MLRAPVQAVLSRAEVKGSGATMSAAWPLFIQLRTSPCGRGTAASCHNRKSPIVRHPYGSSVSSSALASSRSGVSKPSVNQS
jgi:hypothetical protein